MNSLAIDGLTAINRMESVKKNKTGDEILNELAAKRENKSLFIIKLNIFINILIYARTQGVRRK